MLSKFIKWGVLAAAGILAFQAYNWLQHGQWTSITLRSFLEAVNIQLPQAQSAEARMIIAELVHWPLWAWAILISAITGVLAVTIDEVDTWRKVRRVKREFRRLQCDAQDASGENLERLTTTG